MQWHILEHAFDTILEAGEIPHSSFFTEMVCQAVIQNDHERAATLINTMAHAPFQLSEQQWIDLFKENEDRISRASLKQLSDTLCDHHLTSEATVLNLSRALQFLCGSCSTSSSLDSISSGNNLKGILPPDGGGRLADGNGSTNLCDSPPNLADVSLPESLQVTSNDTSSIDCFNHGSDHRVEQTELELVPGLSSYSNSGHEIVSPRKKAEHSDVAFASTDSAAVTYWKGNSSDIEYHDIEVDVAELDMEVSANGNGDGRGSNIPSADEILKSWKERRKNDGHLLPFPLGRN